MTLRLLVAVICLISFSGCSSLTVTTSSGATIKYNRVLSRLEGGYEFDPESGRLKINVTSDPDPAYQMFRLGVEAGKAAALGGL